MQDIEQWINQVYQAGGDQQTLDDVYDRWAAEYDQHLWAIGNPFAAIAAAMLARRIPSFDACILDAGCGTGNLAQLLHQVGYENLTGLDPSSGMLAMAKRKQIYKQLMQLPLGSGAKLPKEQFDAVASTGVLTSGHAPPGAIDDLLTLTKSGGFLVFSLSETALESLGFAEKMESLSNHQQWSFVERSRGFDPHPFLVTDLPTKLWVYVYQKC